MEDEPKRTHNIESNGTTNTNEWILKKLAAGVKSDNS